MMSIRIMTAVWDDKTTKGSERLVLLALADSANDEGFCWPSLETIAKKCNIDRRFVIRLIERLEEKGLIERERRTKDGLYTSNMYRVIVHKVVKDSTPVVDNRPPLSSDRLDTRVVNGSSLKPSFNQSINTPPAMPPQPPEPPEPEDDFVRVIERRVGYSPKGDDYKVIGEWVKEGAVVDDLEAALKFYADNGRHVYGVKQLDKSVRHAMGDRIQAQNKNIPGRSRQGKPKKQERFVEEYGL